MKKSATIYRNILAVLVFGLVCWGTASAQHSFEGSVSYVIRVTGKGAQEFLINEPPNKMDLHIKEDNFIINLSGGRIPRTFLFIGDSNETYVVDAANRRAFLRTYYNDSLSVSPVALPTGDSLSIKGIMCKEYKAERHDRKEIILYYVNSKYRVNPALFKNKSEAKADFLTQGLDGQIPIRKIIKTPDLITEIDMGSIKEVDHAIENFRIPEGFKLRKRDPRM